MRNAEEVIKNSYYGRMLYRILRRLENGAEFLEVNKSQIGDICLPHVWVSNIFETYGEEYNVDNHILSELLTRYVDMIFFKYKKDIAEVIANINSFKHQSALRGFLNSNEKELKTAIQTSYLGSFLSKYGISMWEIEDEIKNKCFGKV